jgi:23S rRNA pseudouridine1911/1915/1917 synthase
VTGAQTELLLCLKEHFGVEQERAKELISLGAVYCNKKRLSEDRTLFEGTYLRIHLEPKRFPVGAIDWSQRLFAESDDFLIVNKPAAIPVHATVDNFRENVLHQLRDLVQKGPFVTQRLDVPVEGLLVLAKSKQFQRAFNRLLSLRKVKKRYHALVESSPPLGFHRHFMEPSERSPRRVSLKDHPSWILCELTIHEARQVCLPEVGRCYEVEVELHTGRTHQIRSQLGALDCPIIGDELYGSKLRFGGGEKIGLSATAIEWCHEMGSVRYVIEPSWKI